VRTGRVREVNAGVESRRMERAVAECLDGIIVPAYEPWRRK
jgi:hypothetical protein